MKPKEKERCPAVKVNSRAPNLECKIEASAHTVHIDPRTGVRWGDHGPPYGMRRKYAKKYGNPKLYRRAVHAASTKTARTLR